MGDYFVSESRAANPSRPGTAVGSKGQRRVEDILDAAARVLTEDGYASFTLRRIADVAEIRLSNLQYYFKIKEDLLNALLKRIFDNYSVALGKIIQTRRGSAKSRFLMIIDYLLKDQESQSSCAIFWELWALAAREDAIATIMNNYYDTYLKQVTDAIREISPEMPKPRAQRHAAAIVSIIEGASLLRGFGKPRRTALNGFEQAIRDVCIHLSEDHVSVK